MSEQVWIVSGSGALLGGPMSADEARAGLEAAALEKTKARAGKAAAFMTGQPEIAAAKFVKVGDSLEVVRRVDFGLGLIEVVDRATFESTTEIRIDRVLAYEDPDTKFVRVDARLARTGVLQYADRDGNVWGELVDEDELFDAESMRSFELVVLTDDHPENFVSVENVKDVQVGHVGSDVRRDGRYLRASVMITDANVIARAKAGRLELSCGYTAAARLENGNRDGLAYRFRQTKRRGNHLSIVDRGRAGPECRLLLDSTSALADWKELMKKKIKIDGIEYELPAEVVDAIEAGRKGKTKAVKIGDADVLLPIEIADAFGMDPEEEEEKDAASNKDAAPGKTKDSNKDAAPGKTKDSDELERLRGKNDALETQVRELVSGEGTRIDARVSLVKTAERILGDDFKTDGMSNAQIKGAIVSHVQPDKKIDVRRTKDGIEIKSGDKKVSEGYLDGLFEGAVLLHDRAEQTADENSAEIFRAFEDAAGGGQLDPVADYQNYIDTRTGKKRSATKET